ncbi:UDP-glycosyltransferase [Polaribacter sp. Z014]|uniref:UDP-glycosyltransferase n=1 Tax=Polaribacter sp. Z014 TaxID=2927126 RepID=UPI00202244E4|nr:UDP-glycosyltransferase [Polaribacter sp. Z014]MCL7764213.1 UDP-glycosyltransferase [Polaribacter sp. Z014]
MKAFILLPDGVGLRNFAFGKFYEEALKQNFDVTYWNNTSFPIKNLGYKEIQVEIGKCKPISDLYKRAKKIIELKQNYKNFKDEAYLSYIFPNSYKSLKEGLKSLYVDGLVSIYNSQKGLLKIEQKLHQLERKSEYYIKSKETLEREKPKVLFLTNQRPASAIAPLLAAQDLNIPTVTFIFSWDNLPKGTMVVNSDYYFVWSEHMKKELLQYYPKVHENHIYVTGSPQFECHYNTKFTSKKVFFRTYNLKLDRRYICFSGDDVTTSPNDQFYLEDVAKAVRNLNSKGYNIGIIYRKCPVDFTNRHIEIYNNFREEIVLIDPKWNNLGNSWNQVMPLPEDLDLLANTVYHTEMVINVGSSMVFDYVAQDKSCAYLNYRTTKNVNLNWDIDRIYKYIHFQSMPSNDAVLWVNSENDIESIIIKALKSPDLSNTKVWYQFICGSQPEKSSIRIWETIHEIINKEQ